MNDDGLSDIVIGSISYPKIGFEQKSLSYVIFGSRSLMNDVFLPNIDGRGVIIIGGGVIVSGPGDLNDDGINDIMITNVQEYMRKGNAYIISYPMKMSTPPSLLPSSFPSSIPSNRSTMIPSSSSPSNYPTNPSPLQSILPSADINMTRGISTPSKSPVSPPTRRPSVRPTRRDSSCPSVSPSTKPPTTRPLSFTTRSPTLRPSMQPAMTSFPTVHLSSPPTIMINDEYNRRIINSSSVDQRGIVYGIDGMNEIFEISSMSSDGKRKSGWSGTIIGGRGKKVYVIYPKDPSQPVNRIILQDFDRMTDVMDLSSFSQMTSKVDLTYFTNPLTLFLPDNQKIIISNLQGMMLFSKNFIFSSQTSMMAGTNETSLTSLLLDTGSLSMLIVLFMLVVFAWIGIPFTKKEKRKNVRDGDNSDYLEELKNKEDNWRKIDEGREKEEEINLKDIEKASNHIEFDVNEENRDSSYALSIEDSISYGNSMRSCKGGSVKREEIGWKDEQSLSSIDSEFLADMFEDSI